MSQLLCEMCKKMMESDGKIREMYDALPEDERENIDGQTVTFLHCLIKEKFYEMQKRRKNK